MESRVCRIVSVLLALLLVAHVRAFAAPITLSPVQRVGHSSVQIALEESGSSWRDEQLYFIVDGKKVALPPASLGYDREYSMPRWQEGRGRIVGIKFWEFNNKASKRRWVHLSFPAYAVVGRGPWKVFHCDDAVPDPPN